MLGMEEMRLLKLASADYSPYLWGPVPLEARLGGHLDDILCV